MKIASFNAQRFGLLKASDLDVLSILVKILSRYDIVVILEVVDVSGASVRLLLRELNRVNTTHHYAMQLSSRLGRNRYKEQFLFLYRDNVVDLVDSYQYEDNQVNDADAFAREPYILRFKSHSTVLKDIVMIPVRSTPWDSEKELDELYDVFLLVKEKWKTDNVIILGDFRGNTDSRQMTGVRIRSDRNFHWLIGDDIDTTAKMSNEHTYDRIVIYGDDMLAAVLPNSAKPFNFQAEYGLTEEMALRVSDHYPVEVELREAMPFWMEKNAQRRDSVSCQNASVSRAMTEQQRYNYLDGMAGIREKFHVGLPVCVFLVPHMVTEQLHLDILKLQKENLQLEQEKLHLQVSLLKQHLLKLHREN